MMKKLTAFLLLLFVSNILSTNLLAQETSPKHKAFKEMSKGEVEHFQCVFGSFEDKYHSSVRIKERQIKKKIQESFDTINAQSASSYINDYHALEKLGISLRNERNQKLLEKINAKEVLNILYQEQLFDREMLKRIRERENKKKEEDKKR